VPPEASGVNALIHWALHQTPERSRRCVSVDRAIDAFSDGIRRESYVEELGRKKPKTITMLMEITNSWADGDNHV
jgi:hypothetical protein